jgi:hypothetical protein
MKSSRRDQELKEIISGSLLLLVLVLIWLCGCGPTVQERQLERQLEWVSNYCGQDVACRQELLPPEQPVGAPAVEPAVIYQPVYQQPRPYVVVPGVAPAVRTQLPGVYAVPSTRMGGSTQFFTVQPLP